MCHKTKKLSQTKNGSLLLCSTCNVYHLSFGHFYLELTKKELFNFGDFLDTIDVDYWNNKHLGCGMRRKIPIPTQQLNLYLMLNRTELEELKRLVFFKEKAMDMNLIQVRDVDYDFVAN